VLATVFCCRDELKNDDPLRRLNSIQRLSTIALALGEERTRSELLPFLVENNDDEDEVLLAMAEELGKFVPYVGGPNYAYTLLHPLEQLSQVEETVVREKAVDSLCKVGEQLPTTSIGDYFLTLIRVGCFSPAPTCLHHMLVTACHASGNCTAGSSCILCIDSSFQMQVCFKQVAFVTFNDSKRTMLCLVCRDSLKGSGSHHECQPAACLQ
jgi:hypothetical protein